MVIFFRGLKRTVEGLSGVPWHLGGRGSSDLILGNYRFIEVVVDRVVKILPLFDVAS